jgi:hypothetical protein
VQRRKGTGRNFRDVVEQQGFRGGQPQIEQIVMWRTKLTPFPRLASER